MENQCISSLVAKFGFEAGNCILLVQPPLIYLDSLRYSKLGLRVSTRSDSSVSFDAVHIFVLNQADIMELAPAAPAVIKKNGPLWFSFPSAETAKTTDINYKDGWNVMTDSGWSVAQTTDHLAGWSSIRFIQAAK